jgi:hypothetical protein
MEIVYVNRAGRAYVRPDCQGLRCWQALSIPDSACPARCAAVRAVARRSRVIAYVDEALVGADGSTIPVGVAVIPLDIAEVDKADACAVLLLRQKVPTAEGAFMESLLDDARRLQRRLSV